MARGYGYSDYEGVDLNRLIVGPLYFGLLVNVVAPMVILFICYWYNNNNLMDNQLGPNANMVFYLFAAIAIAQGGLALWWRKRLFDKPMIRRPDTFEHDLQRGLINRSRPVFLLIAAISIWGYVYFFLTGRFTEGALIVLFSFVVFQVVRPRQGGLRKLVDHQKNLVDQGKFVPGLLSRE